MTKDDIRNPGGLARPLTDSEFDQFADWLDGIITALPPVAGLPIGSASPLAPEFVALIEAVLESDIGTKLLAQKLHRCCNANARKTTTTFRLQNLATVIPHKNNSGQSILARVLEAAAELGLSATDRRVFAKYWDSFNC